MLSTVPPCRSSTAGSAGSHASTCFNDPDPTCTSHWYIPACSCLSGESNLRLFLPLVEYFSWLATPYTAFCFLSTFYSLCEHDMPSLIPLSSLGSTLGSLDQALQKFWLHLYLPFDSDPFSSVNHGNAMTSCRKYYNFFFKHFKVVFTHAVLECVINLSWTVGKGWVEGRYVG